MHDGGPDPKQLGYYFSLAQVGMEMAAPIGLGYLADQWLGVFPWITISGAILGLVGGLFHLVVLARQAPKDDSKDSQA